MELLTLDLAQLQDDGDTLELDETRALRLRIEVDQDANINDFDCYGRVNDERLRTNGYGYKMRPEGFTGNAEKLWWGNDGPWWWEPPADVKRTDPSFREFRVTVCQLLAYGFKGVTLELLEGRDAYGRPIVTRTASLWGIDSLDNGYLAEVVGELVAELEL